MADIEVVDSTNEKIRISKEWKGDIVFSKKENKALFEAMRWLVSAVSKDETRYFMNGVWVEKNAKSGVSLYATDGRRLHRLDLSAGIGKHYGLPDGVIMKVTSTAQGVVFSGSIDGQYPNVDRIVPDYSGVEPFEVSFINKREVGITDGVFQLYSRGLKLNISFLKDLSSLDLSWECLAADLSKAVSFTSRFTASTIPDCTVSALIMPMGLDVDVDRAAAIFKLSNGKAESTDDKVIETAEVTREEAAAARKAENGESTDDKRATSNEATADVSPTDGLETRAAEAKQVYIKIHDYYKNDLKPRYTALAHAKPDSPEVRQLRIEYLTVGDESFKAWKNFLTLKNELKQARAKSAA
jgi:hypothetical protein